MNRARTHPPRVNFTTPPRATRRTNHAPITITLLALALALASITTWQHLQLTLTNTDLTARNHHERERVTSLTTALAPHQALERQHNDTTEALALLRSRLPPQHRWDQHLGIVIERLPGIGTFEPSIILSTIAAAASDGEDPTAFGADASVTPPIALTITLNGHARARDAITTAVEAYERDPHLLTRFPGTSVGADDRYGFRIDLAFLATHPALEVSAP